MDVDGKLSRVRIDAMRQMQVVVLAPLVMVMGERWAGPALIAASLPILAEALISRRLDSMVAWDNSSEIWIDCILRFCFEFRAGLLGSRPSVRRANRTVHFTGHVTFQVEARPSQIPTIPSQFQPPQVPQPIKDDGGRLLRLAAAAAGSASPVHWC